ncbi:MAG: VTC domain-containing protein [Planctomycetes bacterium]|nr:VTC domain-containing protein [Planctomycetota bacterium]
MGNDALETRMERKFAPSAALDALAVVDAHLCGVHPGIRDLHPPRVVLNVYLDTPDLRFYRDAVAGLPRRRKVRIRWYARADASDAGVPVRAGRLEIKSRDGPLVRKRVFGLSGFDPAACATRRGVQAILDAAGLPAGVRESLRWLRPVLRNRYRRAYRATVDGRCRVTIDTALADAAPAGRAADRVRDGAVLELKYAAVDEGIAARICAQIPWRLVRHSKYVTGLARVLLP